MFIKLEDGFYLNINLIGAIEIWDMSELSDNGEQGFRIFFHSATNEDVIVRKHICEEKDCQIEQEMEI